MKVGALSILQRRKTSAFLEMAKNAQRIGRWADAYDAYKMVLGKDGRRFGILVQMGHMSKEMGDFGQAELHYREALSLKPDDWDLHVQFGHLFNRAGELAKAKDWYNLANKIMPTSEISGLLLNIAECSDAAESDELRRETLEHMDARRFKQALPNAVALYERHGRRDFDVIAGHAFRELGQYAEARGMYEKYFERCICSDNRHLEDAFNHLVTILEINEDYKEILNLFVKLKSFYFQKRRYSDFASEQAVALQIHVEKQYGVFRLP